MHKVGITAYGVYVPSNRITTAEIASVWGKNATDITRSLGITEKSVADRDEDAVTLAYEAASSALLRTKVLPVQIDACLVGSESHPYAVNPTSTIVAEFLGIEKNYLAVDLEFACKAATAGIIALSGLLLSGKINYGLAIGSDTAQAKPHDVLEYTAAAGAAAYILSRKETDFLAEILDFASFSSDTPDFWRRDAVRFPSHGGRFTGEPAYFYHVESSARNLLQKTKSKPADFAYCVFHMPNGKFPRQAAKRLGFTEKQLAPSLIIDQIGNPYSASSLLGLAAVLDIAKDGEKIFMVSYGSGAGSDAFILETTKNLKTWQKSASSFADLMKNKKYISYTDYLKSSKKI